MIDNIEVEKSENGTLYSFNINNEDLDLLKEDAAKKGVSIENYLKAIVCNMVKKKFQEDILYGNRDDRS